jgi:hypothetical protein
MTAISASPTSACSEARRSSQRCGLGGGAVTFVEGSPGSGKPRLAGIILHAVPLDAGMLPAAVESLSHALELAPNAGALRSFVANLEQQGSSSE